MTQTAELPAGAIHNGRVLIERLDASFHNFPEWHDLKQCFEHLASHVEHTHD